MSDGKSKEPKAKQRELLHASKIIDQRRLISEGIEDGVGKVEANGKDGWSTGRGSGARRRGREGEEPKEVDGTLNLLTRPARTQTPTHSPSKAIHTKESRRSLDVAVQC